MDVVSARDRVRLFWDSNSGPDEPPSGAAGGPSPRAGPAQGRAQLRGGPGELPPLTEYVDAVPTNALQSS